MIRARDRELRRVVAVKVLSRATEQGTQRFLREVLLTARLQHPSIVPLYDAGVWPSGESFYAMKLVSGKTLAARLAEAATLGQRLALLPSIIDVAEAVSYAHSQRVIHRDLKPQNVLVGEFGETVVIDWGLAKDLTAIDEEDEVSRGAAPEQGQDLTRTDSILGTPGYMPPEQAEQSREVDERADVYALGALLYHLLSGSPPYGKGSPDATLRALLEGPPPPLSGRAPLVPRELYALVDKAMARDPKERYPTARELCDDLKKFQTGQLIGAHRYSLGELVRRWVKRHRGILGVSLFAFVVLATVAAASVARIVRAEQAARSAERDATARADELALISARELAARDPRRALSALLSLSPGAKEWRAARTVAADILSRRRPEVIPGHTPGRALPDLAVALSRDGRTLAFSGDNAAIELVELDSGRRHELKTHDRWVYLLIFSPDGKSLGSFSIQDSTHGTARVWDLGCLAVNGGKEPCKELVALQTELESFAIDFSPDDRWFAAPGPDNSVALFDRRSGRTSTLPKDPAPTYGLAFSRDSQTLITAAVDGSIRLLRALERGREAEVRVLPGHAGAAFHIEVSPDGQTFASVGADRTVKVWSLPSGALLRTLPDATGLMWFSPDGARLAYVSWQSLQVVMVASGAVRAVSTEGAELDAATFSPDGRVLAYSTGPSIHLLDVASSRQQILHGHEDTVLWLAFSREQKELLSASYDGTVRRWTLPVQSHERFQGPSDADSVFAFSRKGRLLAYSGEGRVRLVSLDTRAERDVPGTFGAVNDLAFSPGGDRLAIGGKDGAVSLVDLASFDVRTVHRHDDEVYRVLVSPDGRYVASCSYARLRGAADHSVREWDGRDRTARLFDLERTEAHVFNGSTRPIFDIAFSSDSSTLAAASIDGTVRIVETASMQERVLTTVDDVLWDVEISPDRRTLAVAGGSGIFLIDRETGAKRALTGHRTFAHVIAFSPDGSMLASAGEDSLVILWDVATATVRRTLRGHQATVRALAFSSDGRRLATAGYDGRVLLWELSTFESRRLQGHPGLVLGVDFAPGGDEIVSAGDDGSIRLWKDDLPVKSEDLRAVLSAAASAFDAPRVAPSR